MHIYLLVRKGFTKYDHHESFIIRAKDKKQARELAQKEAGMYDLVWMNPKKSSCDIVKANGTSGIIVADFKAA